MYIFILIYQDRCVYLHEIFIYKKSLNFHFRIFFYFIAPLFPFGVSAADTINDGTDGVAVIDGSVAIGNEAYADYVGSVAIGEHSMAMTSTYGTAVGATSEANGNYSVSVGYDSSVELTATEGTAVGPHAVVLHENSVALGGTPEPQEQTKSMWGAGLSVACWMPGKMTML